MTPSGLSPLDVIVVNDHASCEGGAARVALTQALALARRGHRVAFLAAQASADSPGRAGPLPDAAVPTWITGQWDINREPDRAAAVARGLWNPAAARSLTKLLQNRDPRSTVVVLHSWNKALSSSPAHAAHARGFAVAAVAHDFSVMCPNGGLHDYRTGSPCTLRPMSMACIGSRCDKNSYAHKLWRVGRQFAQKHAGGVPARIDALIFVSEHARRLAAPFLPTTTAQYVLANPVESPIEVAPADVVRNAGFVFVGRLSPEKGTLPCAEAAAAAGVELTLVGDGEQRTAIEAAFPSAEITGWVDTREVAQRISHARALVMPSVCHETFGLVVYEAAALGVPSIVPAESAAAEFVRDGVNGLTFRRGDQPALTACLRRLHENPPLAARLGKQAHADLGRLDLSPDAHGARLEVILRNILHRRLEAMIHAV